MSINAVKDMIHKFEQLGYMQIAFGKGLRATEPSIVKEVTTAITETSAAHQMVV